MHTLNKITLRQLGFTIGENSRTLLVQVLETTGVKTSIRRRPDFKLNGIWLLLCILPIQIETTNNTPGGVLCSSVKLYKRRLVASGNHKCWRTNCYSHDAQMRPLHVPQAMGSRNSGD
jgi:hypothetical protein